MRFSFKDEDLRLTLYNIFQSKDGNIAIPAPDLGEYNEEIYVKLLGHTIEELKEWKKTGII